MDTSVIKSLQLRRVVVVCVALVNVHTWGLNAVSKEFADPILARTKTNIHSLSPSSWPIISTRANSMTRAQWSLLSLAASPSR